MTSTTIPNIAPWPAVRDAQKAVDFYGWRTERVRDPFGHDWEVSEQLTS